MFKAGDTFSERFVVSAQVHEQFIQLFQDKNPLHTDEAFAIAKGFQGHVMQGNIHNGFWSANIRQ